MSDLKNFSTKELTEDKEVLDAVGIRGRRIIQLGNLGLPILPGFVIPEDMLKEQFGELPDSFKDSLSKMSPFVKKEFGTEENPMLIKIVVSPTLSVPVDIGGIHNIGLCNGTVEGLAKNMGEASAYNEYRFLIANILKLLGYLNEKKNETYVAARKVLLDAKGVVEIKKAIIDAEKIMDGSYFKDAYGQFLSILNLFIQYLKGNEVLDDAALLVQAMAFGNYGKESFFGDIYTRDIISGEAELIGNFTNNSNSSTGAGSKKIEKLKPIYLDNLKKYAHKLEVFYKELRFIRFTVEDGTLWLIDQASAPEKSAQAEIKTLLDLLKRKAVDVDYVVAKVQPGRLAEILHPVLDKKTAKNVPSVKGGVSGAVGAAVGRVFFTTDRLIQEFRLAGQKGLDQNVILCMPSTYAEDVKGIEVARGVITNEGGYASHAPVVARSLGKVAMVNTEIKFLKSGMKIGDQLVKEGDYIALDVPSYDEPSIYFGKVELIEPNIDESGIIDFLNLVQTKIEDFDVYVNADQPADAKLARKFNASGIGLCRTEHMFFNENRIETFRSLFFVEEQKEREKILQKLKKMQIKDFYDLFKIMAEMPVTVRLLDSPLHEFIPHTKASMDKFIKFLKDNGSKMSVEDVQLKFEMLDEVNPMLGHRGVRLNMSFPEIYKMQVEAIFEAVYKLKINEGIVSKPYIMIPLAMTERELKAVRYGKKIEGKEIVGIEEIEIGIREKLKEKAIPYKVGTMIELPSAALLSDRIARYADFFSFGTNDLTQTTCGLSRDDFNSFFPVYSEFDLLDKNPFQFLLDQVKEMIRLSVERGRITRPDLKIGLCGEHGAEPDNIDFCMNIGLDYVSCSPFALPLAKLAVAHLMLEKNKNKA